MANRKPPSGREGDREAVEGERVTILRNLFHCNAFSLTRLRRELPLGGSLTAQIRAVKLTDKSKFEERLNSYILIWRRGASYEKPSASL